MNALRSCLAAAAVVSAMAWQAPAQAQIIVAGYSPAPIVAGTHYYAGYPSGVYYGAAYPVAYVAPVAYSYPVTYAAPVYPVAPVAVAPVAVAPIGYPIGYYGATAVSYRYRPLRGGWTIRVW